MRRLRWALLALLVAAPALADVDGFVDLHSHLMAEYSFGGAWFWGRVEGAINPAVVRCDGSFPFKSHATTRWPIVAEILNPPIFGPNAGDTGWHLGKRRGYDARRCRRIFGIPIPGTCPRPHFEGWPTWTTTAHQQMWQGWLQQAHQGGLQVQVVSLAESNFLCINMPPNLLRYSCDEMESVERQAARAAEFVGRNSSWVGIARTAAEARQLIAQGKLALVLSVEITRLFPSGDYLAKLDQWRGLGIRSVQVVHHADNRFGGAAQIPKLKTAADVVEFLFGQNVTGINDIVCRDAAGVGGHCDGDQHLNVQGLTGEGTSLVTAMMDRGMLLDVSHLSRKAFHDVYDLARPRTYPLLYSHTHIWDIVDASEEKNEKFLRNDEIHMITDTGGMIGLRTGPEATNNYVRPGGNPVFNYCQGSSRSFAQSLMWAVDNGLDVGFGADLNGFTRQMKPRAGCWPDKYLISSPTWFQNKGLGQVGLLPELMSDLTQIGVPGSYVDHLNHSAETFLRLWERSESLAAQGPINLARTAQVTASSTYTPGCLPGPHCYSPQRVNDGSRSTALGGFDSWANDYGQPMPQWLDLTWSTAQTVSRVDFYTTQGYAVGSYQIEFLNPVSAAWTPATGVIANTGLFASFNFPSPVFTRGIRVLGWSGPPNQPGYVRFNEIEIY